MLELSFLQFCHLYLDRVDIAKTSWSEMGETEDFRQKLIDLR